MNLREKIGKWATKKLIQIRLRQMKKSSEDISDTIEILNKYHFTNEKGSRFILDEQWFLDSLDELNQFTVKW